MYRISPEPIQEATQEAIHLQGLFRQSDLTPHLTRDSTGPQQMKMSLEAQLAKILLEVEKIQRAEALEMFDQALMQQGLRCGPTSITAVSQHRREA